MRRPYKKNTATPYWNHGANLKDSCGCPMKEGYYLAGEYACSDECALNLYHGDKATMEEDLSHADEDDGECYHTEWDSYYFEV